MNLTDLEKFSHTVTPCGDRLNISKPFSRGEYSYATDGRLLIRVKRLVDVPEVSGAPSVKKIWPNGNYKSFPIPAFPEPKYSPCPWCTGEEPCFSADEYCEECNNTHVQEELNPVTIGCSSFSDHYLSKIKDLPNILIAPTGKLEAAILTFDGGGGLLMPMKI